jgi:hypothetical protein
MIINFDKWYDISIACEAELKYAKKFIKDRVFYNSGLIYLGSDLRGGRGGVKKPPNEGGLCERAALKS